MIDSSQQVNYRDLYKKYKKKYKQISEWEKTGGFGKSEKQRLEMSKGNYDCCYRWTYDTNPDSIIGLYTFLYEISPDFGDIISSLLKTELREEGASNAPLLQKNLRNYPNLFEIVYQDELNIVRYLFSRNADSNSILFIFGTKDSDNRFTLLSEMDIESDENVIAIVSDGKNSYNAHRIEKIEKKNIVLEAKPIILPENLKNYIKLEQQKNKVVENIVDGGSHSREKAETNVGDSAHQTGGDSTQSITAVKEYLDMASLFLEQAPETPVLLGIFKDAVIPLPKNLYGKSVSDDIIKTHILEVRYRALINSSYVVVLTTDIDYNGSCFFTIGKNQPKDPLKKIAEEKLSSDDSSKLFKTNDNGKVEKLYYQASQELFEESTNEYNDVTVLFTDLNELIHEIPVDDEIADSFRTKRGVYVRGEKISKQSNKTWMETIQKHLDKKPNRVSKEFAECNEYRKIQIQRRKHQMEIDDSHLTGKKTADYKNCFKSGKKYKGQPHKKVSFHSKYKHSKKDIEQRYLLKIREFIAFISWWSVLENDERKVPENQIAFRNIVKKLKNLTNANFNSKKKYLPKQERPEIQKIQDSLSKYFSDVEEHISQGKDLTDIAMSGLLPEDEISSSEPKSGGAVVGPPATSVLDAIPVNSPIIPRAEHKKGSLNDLDAISVSAAIPGAEPKKYPSVPNDLSTGASESDKLRAERRQLQERRVVNYVSQSNEGRTGDVPMASPVLYPGPDGSFDADQPHWVGPAPNFRPGQDARARLAAEALQPQGALVPRPSALPTSRQMVATADTTDTVSPDGIYVASGEHNEAILKANRLLNELDAQRQLHSGFVEDALAQTERQAAKTRELRRQLEEKKEHNAMLLSKAQDDNAARLAAEAETTAAQDKVKEARASNMFFSALARRARKDRARAARLAALAEAEAVRQRTRLSDAQASRAEEIAALEAAKDKAEAKAVRLQKNLAQAQASSAASRAASSAASIAANAEIAAAQAARKTAKEETTRLQQNLAQAQASRAEEIAALEAAKDKAEEETTRLQQNLAQAQASSAASRAASSAASIAANAEIVAAQAAREAAEARMQRLQQNLAQAQASSAASGAANAEIAAAQAAELQQAPEQYGESRARSAAKSIGTRIRGLGNSVSSVLRRRSRDQGDRALGPAHDGDETKQSDTLTVERTAPPASARPAPVDSKIGTRVIALSPQGEAGALKWVQRSTSQPASPHNRETGNLTRPHYIDYTDTSNALPTQQVQPVQQVQQANTQPDRNWIWTILSLIPPALYYGILSFKGLVSLISRVLTGKFSGEFLRTLKSKKIKDKLATTTSGIRTSTILGVAGGIGLGIATAGSAYALAAIVTLVISFIGLIRSAYMRFAIYKEIKFTKKAEQLGQQQASMIYDNLMKNSKFRKLIKRVQFEKCGGLYEQDLIYNVLSQAINDTNLIDVSPIFIELKENCNDLQLQYNKLQEENNRISINLAELRNVMDQIEKEKISKEEKQAEAISVKEKITIEEQIESLIEKIQSLTKLIQKLTAENEELEKQLEKRNKKENQKGGYSIGGALTSEIESTRISNSIIYGRLMKQPGFKTLTKRVNSDTCGGIYKDDTIYKMLSRVINDISIIKHHPKFKALEYQCIDLQTQYKKLKKQNKLISVELLELTNAIDLIQKAKEAEEQQRIEAEKAQEEALKIKEKLDREKQLEALMTELNALTESVQTLTDRNLQLKKELEKSSQQSDSSESSKTKSETSSAGTPNKIATKVSGTTASSQDKIDTSRSIESQNTQDKVEGSDTGSSGKSLGIESSADHSDTGSSIQKTDASSSDASSDPKRSAEHSDTGSSDESSDPKRSADHSDTGSSTQETDTSRSDGSPDAESTDDISDTGSSTQKTDVSSSDSSSDPKRSAEHSDTGSSTQKTDASSSDSSSDPKRSADHSDTGSSTQKTDASSSDSSSDPKRSAEHSDTGSSTQKTDASSSDASSDTQSQTTITHEQLKEAEKTGK